MITAESVTGGFNGRSVPPLSLGGFTFTASDPELTVLGVPFGAEERLWFLGLTLFALTWFTARGLLRSIDETMAQQGADLTYVNESGGDNPFTIYGREGTPCPRCRRALSRIVLGGRGTVFCGGCQR